MGAAIAAILAYVGIVASTSHATLWPFWLFAGIGGLSLIVYLRWRFADDIDTYRGDVKSASSAFAFTFEAIAQGIRPTTGVIPQSLGIETGSGIFTTLIERGTPLPAKCTESFTTADDNQPSIQIKVFQGDHEMAAQNNMLGMFEVYGIAPVWRGVPLIQVSFDVDVHGVLKISAYDQRARIQVPVRATRA